jgi:hypothetical protein
MAVNYHGICFITLAPGCNTFYLTLTLSVLVQTAEVRILLSFQIIAVGDSNINWCLHNQEKNNCAAIANGDLRREEFFY